MKISPRNTKRVVVEDPRLWSASLGTDYVLGAGTTTALITAGTAGEVLSEFGWTTTALAYVAGSAADFISSADPGVAPHFLLADASDRLSSASLFGDYAHARAAEWFLGYLPTTLNLECRAAFTTVANNETASGFGFVQDGGSPLTAADHLAFIFSNATNFGLRSSAATDTGAAVDTAWHTWRITISSANVEWFFDGTSQGTIALLTDEFPVSFGAGVQALGVNDVALSHVRIWYA